MDETGRAILQSSGLLFACSQAGDKNEERFEENGGPLWELNSLFCVMSWGRNDKI